MPRHLILGTAGHVDHGKTALVKALTGVDCDTHKEEKRRGITINLGFAHLALASGEHIGIVDVPGHRDFVHTMISGASGIDLVLLVVAADEGIMPQTREHLDIMRILGIRNGLVAVTKQDLVDGDTLRSRCAGIAEFVRGTFLEDRPIIPVSSTTAAGIDELLHAISGETSRTAERPGTGVFRMFIDRVFSVSGFGTVVTGSVLGGSARRDDTIYLLPGGKPLRIRRIERYGEPVDAVKGGDRASLNLVGLEKADFRRGMLLADKPLKSTKLLDARLILFSHSRALDLWSSAFFLLGTYESQARIHLIDRDRLAAGESGIVQIHVPQPCVARIGDRFVVRDTSGDKTLGGGEIIDPAPLHHRRRPAHLVSALHKIQEGLLPELVAAEVRKQNAPRSHLEISETINASPDEVLSVLRGSHQRDLITFESPGVVYGVAPEVFERLRSRIIEEIRRHHGTHPLDEGGLTVEELLGMVGISRAGGNQGIMLRSLLELLASQNALRRVGTTWVAWEHRVEVDRAGREEIQFLENMLKTSGMQAPIMADLIGKASQRKLTESRVNQMLRFLVKAGSVYSVEGTYLHADIVDSCRTRLLRHLASHAEGVTVAQFRDLVGGNRKICLFLLAIYDKEGVTERRGDVRVITPYGKTKLESPGTGQG